MSSHSSPTSFFEASVPKMTGPLSSTADNDFHVVHHLFPPQVIPGYVVPKESDPANIWAPLSTDNLNIHHPSPRHLHRPAFSLRTPPPHPQLPSYNDRMGPLDDQADRFLEVIRQDLIKEDNLKKAMASHKEQMLDWHRRRTAENKRKARKTRSSPSISTQLLSPPYDPERCRCPTHSCPKHPGNTPALAITIEDDDEIMPLEGPSIQRFLRPPPRAKAPSPPPIIDLTTLDAPPHPKTPTPPPIPQPRQITPRVVTGPGRRTLRTNLAALQAKRMKYDRLEARAREILNLGPFERGSIEKLEEIIDLDIEKDWQ